MTYKSIFFIAAHGVSEEFGKSYYGAKKLELSRKKQISLYEFVILLWLNLVFIWFMLESYIYQV